MCLLLNANTNLTFVTYLNVTIKLRKEKDAMDMNMNINMSLVEKIAVKEVDNLDILAERHAMERGERLGRTARQFVECLKSMQE